MSEGQQWLKDEREFNVYRPPAGQQLNWLHHTTTERKWLSCHVLGFIKWQISKYSL
jgi:hypothetical protein